MIHVLALEEVAASASEMTEDQEYIDETESPSVDRTEAETSDERLFKGKKCFLSRMMAGMYTRL